MGRRQVIESVNAALKGSFANLARGFFRVFGRVKISVLLGFTIAAFNLERIRSFRAKHALGVDGWGAPRSKQSFSSNEASSWDLDADHRRETTAPAFHSPEKARPAVGQKAKHYAPTRIE
jgi:hypothetical protein